MNSDDDQLAGIVICDECEETPATVHMEVVIGDEERSRGSRFKNRDLCNDCLHTVMSGTNGLGRYYYPPSPIEEEVAQVVELTALSYMWTCPQCGHDNRETSARMEVICPNCDEHFATKPPEFAIE